MRVSAGPERASWALGGRAQVVRCGAERRLLQAAGFVYEVVGAYTQRQPQLAPSAYLESPYHSPRGARPAGRRCAACPQAAREATKRAAMAAELRDAAGAAAARRRAEREAAEREDAATRAELDVGGRGIHVYICMLMA